MNSLIQLLHKNKSPADREALFWFIYENIHMGYWLCASIPLNILIENNDIVLDDTFSFNEYNLQSKLTSFGIHDNSMHDTVKDCLANNNDNKTSTV